MPLPCYALSVKQPYADLLVMGLKDVENRTWPAPAHVIGRRILIHAGARPIPNAKHQYWALFDEAVEEALEPDRLGGFVGEATLVECVRDHESEWFEGPFGFVLDDPFYYCDLIPYRGRLGFFRVGPVVQLPKGSLV